MIDESKLLDMADEELMDILRTLKPMETAWVRAKAALDVKNARRMVESGRRIEWATYAILVAAAIQLTATVIPMFRH